MKNNENKLEYKYNAVTQVTAAFDPPPLWELIIHKTENGKFPGVTWGGEGQDAAVID